MEDNKPEKISKAKLAVAALEVINALQGNPTQKLPEPHIFEQHEDKQTIVKESSGNYETPEQKRQRENSEAHDLAMQEASDWEHLRSKELEKKNDEWEEEAEKTSNRLEDAPNTGNHLQLDEKDSINESEEETIEVDDYDVLDESEKPRDEAGLIEESEEETVETDDYDVLDETEKLQDKIKSTKEFEEETVEVDDYDVSNEIAKSQDELEPIKETKMETFEVDNYEVLDEGELDYLNDSPQEDMERDSDESTENVGK